MTDQNKNELVITRVFNASVGTVWKYWRDPELFKIWWGPKDFTAPHISIDFRVGGKYLYCMRGRAGPGEAVKDFWSTGRYKKIIPMKKIVVADSFADEHGNVVSATYYGMKGFPMELEVTLTFEEVDGKTTMTLVSAGIADLDKNIREGMREGWSQSFDKIVNDLAKS